MEMRSYSDFPEEISFDILSRLPAKSVGQYRCVSKPWKELLYRPEFIKAHLQSSRIAPHESLVRYSYRERSLVSASLSDARDPFNSSAISTTKLSLPFTDGGLVHGSCDGLVLVSDGDVRQCVVNPITREINEIPPLPFDPPSIVCRGFGYDSVNHDYKVVALPCYYEDYDLSRMCVHIYSLKRGSWESQSSIYPYEMSLVTSGVFVNGCIHWSVVRAVDLEPAILAFNAVEEELRELPLPSSDDGRTSRFNHATICCGPGGHLWMFCKGETETDVWVMKQYGVKESWTKVASICLVASNIRLVGLSRQDEVVLNENFSKSVIYNLKQGTVQDIVVDETSENFPADASYVESLLSPWNSEAW